jgi:hypothetical protein
MLLRLLSVGCEGLGELVSRGCRVGVWSVVNLCGELEGHWHVRYISNES